MGQISGIVFIFAMDAFRVGPNGSMTPSLIVLTFMVVIVVFIALRLRESDLVLDSRLKIEQAPEVSK